MRSRVIRILSLGLVLAILTAINISASGPAGVFAVVEKVVFEPNEQAPERIQLWGAFAFVAGGIQGSFTAPPQRGYLYFSIPATATPQQLADCYMQTARFAAIPFAASVTKLGDILEGRDIDGNAFEIPLEDAHVRWEICRGCGDEFFD